MKLKLLTIIFLSAWFFSCTCPPIVESKEEIEKLIQSSESIFIGEVFDINYENSTNKVFVVEVFKGKIKVGDTLTCMNDNYCGPYLGSNGKWLVFGVQSDYFRPYQCNPSFNLKEPHIYPPPPPPPPGSNEKWKTTDDPKWKKKNEKLAERILKQVKKIKTVPNKK